jgi:hypothetical protein
MIKNRKKLLISIFFFAFLFLSIFSAINAKAESGKFKTGLENTASKAGYTDTKSSFGKKTPEQIIAIVINALLGIIGILLLALLLYGGFIWMNAKGNDADVKKAQDIIRNAIIGIIIVLSAYVISSLVFNQLLTISVDGKSYIRH